MQMCRGRAQAYVGLFRLVTYDAGACSLDNAAHARSRDVHYLFGLKDSQRSLLAEAVRCLGSSEASKAAALSEDIVSGRAHWIEW